MNTDKERIKQLENELAMRDQTILTLQNLKCTHEIGHS